MAKRKSLSRREREMMDIIYRSGHATAIEVMDAMAEPPSYSAVRATLRVLEQKGHLRHENDGTRYVYKPTVGRDRARVSALDHIVATFFDGSVTNVVATLLDNSKKKLDRDELERLSALIDKARKEGR
jgi:predicted transcriptional regulator